MSFPQYESDEKLEAILKGQNLQSSEPDAELMQSLVSNYQAKALPNTLKERIWKNAQLEKGKNRVVKARFNWVGSLVASLVLIIGVLVILVIPSVNTSLFAALQANTAATETVLENSIPLLAEVPVISSAFGFEYGGYANITNQVEAGALMHDANMTWVAINVYQDEASIPSIQSQIQIAHLNGFKILVSVSGPQGLLHFNVERYPAYYAEFVAQIAAAGADAIEIWPEANLDRSMPQALLGADTYAAILGQTSSAIRESNPNTIIISGAPAPTGAESAFPQQVINDDNFLNQLMALGALDAVDCIGMHYNEGTVPPLATGGDMRDDYYTRYLPRMLQSYRGIVEASIPICITSMGYFSTEGLTAVPSYFQWGNTNSREEQEQWLSDAMEWLSLQTDVKLAIIWNIDYPPTSGDDTLINQGFSLTFPHNE